MGFCFRIFYYGRDDAGTGFGDGLGRVFAKLVVCGRLAVGRTGLYQLGASIWLGQLGLIGSHWRAHRPNRGHLGANQPPYWPRHSMERKNSLVTYFTFLLLFLGIPILSLLGLTFWDRRQGKRRPSRLSHWPAALGILLHVVIAVLYTTPWDNYLVATKVWWYDPGLVTGVTLGWVPIEEYTFFVVQPILGGLWLWFLARRLSAPANDTSLRTGLRWQSVLIGFVIWMTAVVILLVGWQPGTYLALELGWAMVPIMLQFAFGADILWRYRRLVFLSLVPLTLYLSAADALAINFGTWTISPSQSLNILLGGILPIEEFIFFLITNTLITFGLVLIWAEESHERLRQLRDKIKFGRKVAPNRKGQTSISNI